MKIRVKIDIDYDGDEDTVDIELIRTTIPADFFEIRYEVKLLVSDGQIFEDKYISFPFEITEYGYSSDNIKYTVKLISNLNGPIAQSFTFGDGGSFSGYITAASTLQQGEHVITIEVVGESGEILSSNSVNIFVESPYPNGVQIDNLTISEEGLSINWIPYSDDDFHRLTIRRKNADENDSQFETIATITDVNVNIYLDTTVKVGVEYVYKITVFNQTGYSTDGQSIVGVYETENFIKVTDNIVRIKPDKNRPYLYAVDDVTNQLMFININTKTVEKSIFIGSKPSDFDFNLENDKMYVANFGSSEVKVIDLNSQTVINSFTVNTNLDNSFYPDGNPYRIAWMSGDRIVYTSEDQWQPVKIADASTGEHINTVNHPRSYSFYNPGLITDSSKKMLFISEFGSSGSNFFRYSQENNELIFKDQTEMSYPGIRDASITEDDRYIFFDKYKFSTSDVSNLLGTFGETIYACNFDGSIAIGKTKIWNGNQFTEIKPSIIETNVLTVKNNTLYGFKSGKIYIIDLDY